MKAPSLTLRSHDPEDTRALAAATAHLLDRGDVVALTGELGAGKTCFVQGAARELGVTRRVTSPTFMLVRLYDEADPPIVHCDVYRLERVGEVLDLGDDVLGPGHLTFVEWGDAVAGILPDDRLEVVVEFAADPADPGSADLSAQAESERVIEVRAHGRWSDRLDDLRSVWQPWLDTGSAPC